jgi:hypothetical protein
VGVDTRASKESGDEKMTPMELVNLVELSVKRGEDLAIYEERGTGSSPKPLPTDAMNILLEFGRGVRR